MEGYLSKKGRGDGNFGRRTWKKRWFVLEGQQLTYFEELDMESGFPVNEKGVINVVGCTCAAFPHHEKKYTFVIKSRSESDLILQAPDTKMMNLWIQEINKAGRGENVTEKFTFPEMFDLLGLKESDNPSPADVSRAYRKKALKCHPDKGGDMAEFKRIQDAFNRINARFDEEEANKSLNIFTFEVVLTKNPNEIALGLSVREEAETKRILIREVMEGITINSIAPSAKGTLLPGDCLVRVRNEDIKGMSLLRVAQKLNDFRVPPSSKVRLTFERREPKEPVVGDPDQQGEEQSQDAYQSYEHTYTSQSQTAYTNQSDDPDRNPSFYVPPPEPYPTTNNNYYNNTNTYTNTNTSAGYVDDDIDESTPEERAAQQRQQQQQQQQYARNHAQHARRTSTTSHSTAPPQNATSHGDAASHLDPVTYVSALAENEELRAEVEEKARLLAEQREAQEFLVQQLQKMQNDLQRATLGQQSAQELLFETQLRQRMAREQLVATNQVIQDAAVRLSTVSAPLPASSSSSSSSGQTKTKMPKKTAAQQVLDCVPPGKNRRLALSLLQVEGLDLDEDDEDEDDEEEGAADGEEGKDVAALEEEGGRSENLSAKKKKKPAETAEDPTVAAERERQRLLRHAQRVGIIGAVLVDTQGGFTGRYLSSSATSTTTSSGTLGMSPIRTDRKKAAFFGTSMHSISSQQQQYASNKGEEMLQLVHKLRRFEDLLQQKVATTKTGSWVKPGQQLPVSAPQSQPQNSQQDPPQQNPQQQAQSLPVHSDNGSVSGHSFHSNSNNTANGSVAKVGLVRQSSQYQAQQLYQQQQQQPRPGYAQARNVRQSSTSTWNSVSGQSNASTGAQSTLPQSPLGGFRSTATTPGQPFTYAQFSTPSPQARYQPQQPQPQQSGGLRRATSNQKVQ